MPEELGSWLLQSRFIALLAAMYFELHYENKFIKLEWFGFN